VNGIQWNDIIIKIIKKYILEKKLTHFLNVGSHIGTVCLPISLTVDKVTAIEAYPPTYKYLCENIEKNNIKNITTHNIAVGNIEDIAYFMGEEKICPKENKNRVINNTGGMHVFVEDDFQNNRRSCNLSDKKIKVKVSLFDNLDIDDFDIMLVDIEGTEHEFLLGAREKIKKNKPIIIIEIWNNLKRKQENMATTQEDIINLIISMNYTQINRIGDDFIFEPITTDK
jgi:FkbM family methyltransferase